ncbi:flagellar type III secretion system protein FlhB [Curvibacter sp. HBC61]|uniref:Flagellar type III secretion system protein FlhB n=1 Tax=Curvibacter cyanobacteriorum TaxID=3026422 RepID=A0ABT5N394_9BURK|nr:flagellar type III secretion system protein FlhB [Curvibacter sp. HBC61]MDD0840131.1 flagellar type III secretion system protein FlhB [Curvibacter sp. HBC61]
MSDQDRPLPASARKLAKARGDGQASRSRDISHLLVLGAGAAALWVLTPTLVKHLKLVLVQQLSFNASRLANPLEMLTQLQHMSGVALVMSVLFAGIVSAASIGGQVASGGWVFSLTPMMPDLSRLNPITGLGNLVSKQQIVNVLKLVLLSTLMGWVGWVYLSNSFQEIAGLLMQPSVAAVAYLTRWLVTGLALLMLIVFAAAVIDVPLQKYFFMDKLKMSYDEVKREHKDAEGNPHVKGKLRAKQREMAQRRSIANVPKADFVVMNPTHFAVALKYDEATMSAPQVIAKGADLLAFKIREVANAHQVPVLQSPMLARALYAHAELDQTIPSALYSAVAQVLAYVYRLKAAMRGQGPLPQQPDPFVPPELDPLNKPKAAGADA